MLFNYVVCSFSDEGQELLRNLMGNDSVILVGSQMIRFFVGLLKNMAFPSKDIILSDSCEPLMISRTTFSVNL